MIEAEDKLLVGGTRRKCLSVLKTLRDRQLELPGQTINNVIMKNLVLYECEKHPYDYEWEEGNLAERINGIMLQLIACLQSRRFPAYFLPLVDAFKGKDVLHLDFAAKHLWRTQRQLMFNSRCLEEM